MVLKWKSWSKSGAVEIHDPDENVFEFLTRKRKEIAQKEGIMEIGIRFFWEKAF
jgi:hypothetical protein